MLPVRKQINNSLLTLTVTLKVFSQVAVVSCECPVFDKRFFFYILVLELLALLRIQEELRDSSVWKIGKFFN